MGKRCAVNGCTTSYDAVVKKQKLLGKKPVAIFTVPKVITIESVFILKNIKYLQYTYFDIEIYLLDVYFSVSSTCRRMVPKKTHVAKNSAVKIKLELLRKRHKTLQNKV